MRRLKSGTIKIAGCPNKYGHINVSFKGKYYYGHIISFILDKGYPPKGLVDHKDGDPANNRPDNLRESSYSENRCNSKPRKDNSSGYRGGTNWQVKITIKGKCHSKSGFRSPEEANQYAIALREKLHGEFARHD